MSTTTLHRDPVMHRLLEAREGPCVTILMTTHRTAPDALQDPIRLKELTKQAESRLLEGHEKRAVSPILQRLEEMVKAYDNVHATDGLALFVSADHGELVRLPFPVADRTVVGDTFATRDVVRARLGDVDHHVLVLSTKGAYLYQASSERLVKEVRGDFPIENRHYTTDALSISSAKGQEHLLREYHHEVDRKVQAAVGDHGRVVVAGAAEQYAHLLNNAQHRSLYLGNLTGNHEHVPVHEIIAQAWPVAYEDQKRRHLADLATFEAAPNDLRATSVADIWRLVREGRGRILLVERDKRVAARIAGDALIMADEPHTPGITDDVVDDIIEEQLRLGGDVRILPNGLLAAQDGIALVLRY